MAAQVLARTRAGQDSVGDPPGAPSSTSRGTSGGSQSNTRLSDARKNVAAKDVSAASQVANVSKKPCEKDDDGVVKCPLQCAVPCCTRTGERLYQTTFFPCPLEPHHSSRLWAKAIGVKAIQKNMYICEDHFQLEDDLENYLKFKYYPRGQQRFPRFKKGVVPWKFPKCRGSSPTVHHHRVPFSKTEFYKRQRARINRARGILSAKENNISPKNSSKLSKYEYNSQLRETSKVEGAKDKTRPAQTIKTNAENDQNVGTKRKARTSTKKRKSEGRENSSSSEKGAYFNLLNGDLSTLIAHVQPAICSWDVSEVKLDRSGSAKQTEAKDGLGEFNSGQQRPESLGEAYSDSKDDGKFPIVSKNSASTGAQGRKRKKSASSVSESSLNPQISESVLSRKSDEDSEDEIYMTPSEDEMNGYRDTSDTDFTLSSEESWGDHEVVKPTRRSARNQSRKVRRTDRYSPPVVLRSRAKKRSDEDSDATALEPTLAGSKTKEKRPQPDEVPENSHSGVSSGDAGTRQNGTCEVTSEESGNGIVESASVKSPTKVNKMRVTPKKRETSHVENLSRNNVDKVIQAISGATSDSESIGDTLDVNCKAGESCLPKSPNNAPRKVVETTNDAQSRATNPKWKLREAKSPLKGARLTVDMSDEVAKVYCPESQTSYSYKKVTVGKKLGTSGVHKRRGKQDNFLLVRDGDQVFSTTNSLPPHICGLIMNMRNSFDSFFDNLDALKAEVRLHHSENAGDSCLAEPNIDRFLNELKKYPDLLELEMAQFALKCEKFHSDEMEKSLKTSKKIRWCNTCPNVARFHCCFSAAYCCKMCQSKDWGRHNRQCGQSRMLLDDPDLKLNPYMANRLKAVGNSKPTIGICMSNLEELHQVIRRPTNGQRILGSKNQPRCVKRINTLGLSDAANPKVMRNNYSVRSYLPASMVANASPNTVNNRLSDVQPEEEGNATIKTEPPDVDMEVERGPPPPRPNLVGYSLVNNISPSKTPAAGQQVRITIPPNLLASLPSNVRPVVNAIPVANRIGQSNTTTVNAAPRIASVALVPRSAAGSSAVALPKNTSPGTTKTAPVTLRCKTVILPTGETQYIPVDGQTWSFKPNAQFVVKQINQSGAPVTLLKQASTSGSILITRPAKPAYSKFIPISPAPTQTITSSIMSPEVTTAEPSESHSLTAQLPKLTPVTPKAEPPAVRTLDSSELDKILSTDHLKEAFDMSYASNILRP